MNKIEYITNELQKLFESDSSGHDYWHTIRVHKMAIRLAETEQGCNKLVAELAALLHDADDPKLFEVDAVLGDHGLDYPNARHFMDTAGVDKATAEQVIHVIEQVSFKGKESVVPDSLEGMIVQDADRLDAMGATGIARTFAFGGAKGKRMYDPDIPPRLEMDREAYLSGEGTTVNHFYEKLFLLKDMMNTECAREIADRRDKFMRDFIEELNKEWEVN